MGKIVVVLDAAQPSFNTIHYACSMAKFTNSKLTGVFLEDFRGEPISGTKNRSEGYYAQAIPETAFVESNTRIKLSTENIHLFKTACKKRDICFSVHRGRRDPMEEIILESRFADMLIVNAEMSFQKKAEQTPTNFVKEILVKSECPVIIAPSSFDTIDEVMFAYDGSASSVFAIKQFTYLFPGLMEKKMTILQVSEKENLSRVVNHQIRELLQMHYCSIGFRFLRGKPGEELYNYLASKKNVFVVMGAFGRTMLSTFFRHSTAEVILRTIDLPVFIAHH